MHKALEQLKQQGYLDKLAAIVLPITDANGNECSLPEKLPLDAMQRVVNEVIGDRLPVYFGAPTGHAAKGQYNLDKFKAVPLLTQARLHHKEMVRPVAGQPVRRVTMEIDMHRKQESYEAVSEAYNRQIAGLLYFLLKNICNPFLLFQRWTFRQHHGLPQH